MNCTCPLCGEPAQAEEFRPKVGGSVQVINCPCNPLPQKSYGAKYLSAMAKLRARYARPNP